MSEEIPAFLGITPFGVYCKLCNNQSLSIQRGILLHSKEFHLDDGEFKNATVVREVHRQMKMLRDSHSTDLTPFLTEKPSPHPTWFCTGCFASFNKSCNFSRHRDLHSSSCFGGGGKMNCFVTICGRLGPKSCSPTTLTIVSEGITTGTTVSTITHSRSNSSTNNHLVVETDSKVPVPLLTTKQQAISMLEPFVRPDEEASKLYEIYLPLLNSGFEGTMKEYLSYSASQPAEDAILFNWLKAGRIWLEKYAGGHISNVSANVRRRLAEFEQKDIDGVTVGHTFTLRRGVDRLTGLLDAILRFFYRYPTTLFDDFKSTAVQNATMEWMIELAIIPKILFTAAAEDPENHGRLPVACLYGLSRGFNSRIGYRLVMNECGWFASHLSGLLHILRAGVCGYLVTLSRNSSPDVLTMQEMAIVTKIQNCRVTNLLSSYVRRLRDQYDTKPKLKTNTVNGNGDITSGSFTFPYVVWSTIIPRIVSIARACFQEIFTSYQWKLFITEPISMTDWVRLEASVVHGGSQVWIHDLGIKEGVQPVLGRLQSVAELCFLGLGTGAVRHEEVTRLNVLSCQWHNSYLYFWTESLKRGSLKASTKARLVEHRLSLSVSKIVLLIRYVLCSSVEFDAKKLLPNHPDASMVGLMQDLFDFDCTPHKLDIRHLFTSIGNIIMPENGGVGGDGCFVSTLNLTEKSGHTQVTGRRAYGTWLEDSDEMLYDQYHRHLGEVSVDPPRIHFTPFSDATLKASLKELVGPKAVYRSDDQKRMIHLAANSVGRHAFVGLPCGQGKSLSWMVPVVASYLSGRHVGLRIVILPYKFLLGHVVHHATTMMQGWQEKLTISFLDSSHINAQTFPDILATKEVPSLVFVNLDGAALLLRFHLSRLQALASQSILKRLYLDEFQQLIVEYGFRKSYQCLQELGRVGAPVMCLSGSLPLSIAMSLMSYCGLSQARETDSLDILSPNDPIGDGFTFGVQLTTNVSSAIIDFVLKSRVGACHVLCSSKSLVETISSELSRTLKVLSITGDCSYQEQIRCAESWFEGDYDILVSTVVGLVGNENRYCKTVVVGGFLFNVSSLVQAIGRLRPTQRGPDSIVEVFSFPFREDDRLTNAETSETLFDDGLAAGFLSQDDKSVFRQIFAPVGLQDFLLLNDGCYLQALSGFYGFARLPCNRCALCIKMRDSEQSDPSFAEQLLPAEVRESFPLVVLPTVVHESAMVVVNPYKKRSAVDGDERDDSKRHRNNNPSKVVTIRKVSEGNSKVTKTQRRNAKWVLSELLYRCLACGMADCNGELCLQACFRCGDRYHKHNACSFDTAKHKKILGNKGVCFGCFDTLQHTMVLHDMFKCPLKKKLKRLLFLDRERKGMEYEKYLRQLYASELSFVSTVASYSHDTMLGRYVFVYCSDAH